MVRVGAIFAYTLFALSWLSWVVMLGGAAGMQAKCGGYLGRTLNIKIIGQDLDGIVEGCDTTNTTAWIWWSVWFEFFLLVLLSVAECCRVQGLFLTKQIFLAMVSVCMMLAADRANQVISTYDGALRNSARACMAGQIITIICNLVMLLYFGGEIKNLHRSSPDDKMAEAPVMSADVSHQYANEYEAAFDRLVQSATGSAVSGLAAAESKLAQRQSKAAAAALGAESWQA